MALTRLVIATRNQGKIPEIQKVLEGLPVECLSLADIPSIAPDEDVEEPAMTFEGNAIIKVFGWGSKTGILTLADDAGLIIDALDGRPGVKSARYVPGTDQDRYEKVLEEMKDVPEKERTGRYVSVAAIFDPVTKKIRTCQGVSEVMIAHEPKGEHGFGYDPITRFIEFSKTGAELTLEEKTQASHRGKSMREARKILEEEFLK